MSIDTGRERTDEKRRPQRRAVRLTPDVKPGQAGELLAPSPSQESADRSKPRERRESSDPKENAKDGARGISLFPTWLGRLRYYGLALLLVAVAALLHWVLWDVLSPTPFLVFYLAWVGAAAFGGLGPGLLAAVASWLCVELLFDFTSGHIGFSDPTSMARLLVFLAGGLVISVVGEGMRQVRIRERRQGRELAAANAALRVSEQQYRFLVENSKDITGTIDLRGKPTFVSANVEKMTGYRPEEFIGKTIWDFLAPECHDLVKENLRRRLRGEDVSPYELLAVGKDGRRIPFEVVMASIVDDGGNIVGVQGVFRDITERKRAEEALRASEEKYRGLVEKVNDWVWEIDANGVYTYSSPRALDLLGYLPEEIVGKTPFDFMPPAEAQRVWDAFRPTWLERKPLEQLENTLVRKDGRLVIVETSGMPVFGEDGVFRGYSGIDRDVTARKEAEEALRESEERFRKIFEEGPIGMVLTSRDFGFFRANPAFCRMLGYTSEEMNGLTFLDVTHPEHRAADRDNVERLWQGEIPIYRTEKRYLAKNGDIRWGNLSASLIQDREGRPLYALAIVEDITERKWAEEQLRRSEQDLNRAQAVAQTGSWRLDVRRNELLWSDETYRMFGIPQGTPMTYETFLAAVHPVDREYVDRQWTAALRGEPYDIEHRILVEGELKWVREKAELEFDEAETLLGGFGTVQDITGRKRAEEALRASQESLALAQEIAHLGNWSWDLRTNEQEWSDESFRIFGFKPGECRPNRDMYLALLHPEDRERFLACWKDALERNVPFNMDYRIIRRDGSVRHIRSEGQIVRDDEGQPSRVFGINQDITERKRAEEALQASEEKYRFLVENSKDITWMIDLQGRWTFISSNVEKVIGYRADEVVGKTIWDFLAPECHDLVQEKLGQRRRGEDVLPYEVLVVGRDNRRTPFELHTAPILDDRGRMVGVQGVSRDITERKKAEEALREWNATLESKVAQRTEELERRARQLQKLTLELTEAEERERKRLAEILHDDLQQVLAAAKFQVGLLGSRVKDDAEAQEIAGQTRQLLVDAIAKSRGLSHELSAPALSQSDLAEAFQWLAEQMRTKHGLTVHLDTGERVELRSEPLRVLLYKAAQELLFNVIKHAGVHEAKLRLRHRRGRLWLSVSDKGRGFDPMDPACCLGFGLLSIRERVGYLGGRLKIKSAVGKGSTFLLAVPDSDARDGE